MKNSTTATIAGNNITLSSWEGSTTGTLSAGNQTTHQITTDIPNDKIIIVSLSSSTAITAATNIQITLRNANGVDMQRAGGWYTKSKMAYFSTAASANSKYTITINSPISASYTIYVVAVNRILNFTPTDHAFYSEYANSTYMISAEPEMLNNNQQKGEWGYFLARGRLKARCNLYFEHINQFATAMSFGVLLWNKGNTPVVVSLASRSVKSYSGTGSIVSASTGVWSDRFNDVKQADTSELPTSGSITIPAYNSSSPSSSARWVALTTVPGSTSGINGFFNGVVSLQLKNSDGSWYVGTNLYCDTYLMTMNYESQTKTNVANAAMAAATSPAEKLRGSGTGAGLSAIISNTITVSATNPYNFLITGYDVPGLQTGELFSIDCFNANGVSIAHEANALNYGVHYRFVFNGFSSTGTIKARIRFNTKTSPAAAANEGNGLYIAGYISSQAIFTKLLTNATSEYVFSTNVPKNQQVILNLVVSGMSSMPLEVDFYN